MLKTKRLNLKLKPETDTLLRTIASDTGLKLVTIIDKGIHLYDARRKQTK